MRVETAQRICFDMAGNAMDTQKRLHENISALADGELPDGERELAMAALGTAEGQAAWNAYHLIGDVLRDQASGALSDGFSASLATRLAAEAPLTPSPAPAGRAAADTTADSAAPAAGQSKSQADVILP
jgi:sigma-E factor negative regulatory protein RseA